LRAPPGRDVPVSLRRVGQAFNCTLVSTIWKKVARH
jgi:hypothetical protein